MNPETVRDLGSTIAGGGAGMFLLTTVKWEQIAHGELVKVGLAAGLIVVGYFMYRKNPPAAAA